MEFEASPLRQNYLIPGLPVYTLKHWQESCLLPKRFSFAAMLSDSRRLLKEILQNYCSGKRSRFAFPDNPHSGYDSDYRTEPFLRSKR